MTYAPKTTPADGRHASISSRECTTGVLPSGETDDAATRAAIAADHAGDDGDGDGEDEDEDGGDTGGRLTAATLWARADEQVTNML